MNILESLNKGLEEKYFKDTLLEDTAHPNNYTIDGDVATFECTDVHGNPIATFKVDAQDVDKVLKYRWHCERGSSPIIASHGTGDGKKLTLGTYILGEDCPNGVIHLDGNLMNYQKSNLKRRSPYISTNLYGAKWRGFQHRDDD